MEDGFPLFDPNDEAARQEQRLREFYEEYSADARKRLLAKNVIRPESVYDVLYPQTREALLSKNMPINTNLEEDSKIIRDRLIAKIVTEETDLEKISEDFRKSLLARKKIQEDRESLMRTSESVRASILSKNAPKESDLEKDSSLVRNENLAKNKKNLSSQSDIVEDGMAYRENAQAKNAPKDQDLLRDSESYRNQFRKNDIHKNVSIDTDLEKDSVAFRKANLSKNTTKPQDIDEVASAKRREALSKNTLGANNSDLLKNSEQYRIDDTSKNVPKEQDLLRDSDNIRNQFRKNDLSKNQDIKVDLEKDSVDYRRNNVGKNTSKQTDIESDSASVRESMLSNNVSNNLPGLEETAEQARIDDLSKNNTKITDLEEDSKIYREDDLSKNETRTTDLEADSVIYRNDDLSKNKPKTTDLEKESITYRADDLSKNKPSESNLEEDSVQYRLDDLSLNLAKESDLERDSVDFRKDDLSLNVESLSNLEVDSVPFRIDDLSFNRPNTTDLEVDSVPFRADDLSKNKPIITNLETDSVVYREDDLSYNVPSFSDLEVDSVPFRLDDLSFNVANNSDLETDSIPFRNDDLSFNVPNTSDLIVDSTPYLFNNLSNNVPNISDLETDSVPYRADDLSANVPNTSDLLTDSEPFRVDDLSANVPTTSDLESDSEIYRLDDLANNVSINSNLAIDSIGLRENNLSANVPKNSDLLTDSAAIRNDAIAKNEGYGLLGINVQGAGTSSFLGVSRVFTQGILLRQLLLSKNSPNGSNLLNDSLPFRENNIGPNKWQYGNQEYTSTNENWTLGRIMQGSINTPIVDYTRLEPYYTPTAKAIFATDDYIVGKAKELQKLYGVSNNLDFPTKRRDRTITDALYSVDTNSDKGGNFLDYFFRRDTYVPFWEGSITSTVRNYNQERNAFNLKRLQPGNVASLNELQGVNVDGFQDLISKTIGSFKAVTQIGTLTTPASIINKNLGTYYAGGDTDTDILRPNVGQEGSAESMMAKTVLGNPFEDEDFLAGRRGVKHVINTIKSSDDPTSIRNNFDPQNNRAYIIGKNRDGSPRVARQRFTINNPYAPQGAGKLLFFIKNYASNEQFYFPPYIQSIQNTENANWNSTTFLGRPEAIYTYNNASRDASISFYVLTDYAQNVDIGRNWGSENMEKVTASFSRHFTDKDKAQNDARKLRQAELEKKREEDLRMAQEYGEKIDENNRIIESVQEGQGEVTGDNIGTAVNDAKAKESAIRAGEVASAVANASNGIFEQRRQDAVQSANKSEQDIVAIDNDFNSLTNYSESSEIASNIYNINVIKKEYENGETVYKPEDTIVRIDTMKEGLMFQPSYFSGDKVDFVRKIEFLSKLTRPAAAAGGVSGTTGTGFSFTKPPVCHIHLGDWWNHDIIVNSVSFDYADAPWTLEGGRVQPMWALVTINFNMIGPFKSFNASPPLATDEGGMYSPLKKRT